MKLEIEIPDNIVDKFNLAVEWLLEECREPILVPDNIKIERECWHWDELGIAFNDNKQVLSYFSYNWWIYDVDGASDEEFIQCELIKCKREDLEPWDTAFRCEGDIMDKIGFIGNYYKILDDKRYAYISRNTNIVVGDNSYNNRYKVVEV